MQILESNKSPSGKDKFWSAINAGVKGLDEGLDEYQSKIQTQKQKSKINEYGKKLGIDDLAEFPIELQKEIVGKKLQGINEESKQGLKLKNQQDLLNQFAGEFEDTETMKQEPAVKPTGILKPEFEEPEKPSKKSAKLIPQKTIIAAAIQNPAVADKMQKHNDNILSQQKHEEDLSFRKEEAKKTEFQKDREYHTKTSQPIIESATKIVNSAPAKKGLINQHRRDIASGNVSGYGQFVADKTGWEIFRSPEAARSRSAAKQYFIQSLNSLANGARPNVFIEQQLSAGQTQIGREEEANQSVLDLMEFTDDLQEHRARLELQLAKEDEDKYGYPRNDIARRAENMMIPYAEQREDEMAYTIRRRTEEKLSDDDIIKEIYEGKIPQGTPLTPRMANILRIKNNEDLKKAQSEAKRLGLIFPTEETLRKIK